MLLLFELSMKLIFKVAKPAQRFPFKQRLIFKDMIINSCITMAVVFNFIYIFLKKLKLIEPNISVAEKTLLGRRKLSGEGGGCWGV